MSVIRVIDFETTGLLATDEIIEIGAVDVLVNVGEPVAVVLGADLVRPAKPISIESMAVHHLQEKDLADAAPWAFVRKAYFSAGVEVYAAHRAAFEGMWATAELRAGAPLICTWKASLRIWPEAPSHSNQGLRYFLGLDLGPQAMPPHRAMPDAYVTAHVLIELLKRATIEQMIEWTAEPPILPRCTIGEWRGKPWGDVDKGFLEWCLSKKDMDADIVWNARRELTRRADAEIAAFAAKQESYTAASIALIGHAVTVEDLRCWFAWEADERSKLKIYPDTDCYKRIVAACTEKTKALPPAIPKPIHEAAHAQA